MALVMYDLDGTLVDTAGEIALAVNNTLTQYGHPEVYERQIKVWIGYGTAWLMTQAWPNKAESASPQAWEAIMRDFMLHYNAALGTKSRLYPKVLETLVALKKRGIKQAVITNKEQPFTSHVLEKNGIAAYFDLVISGNTLAVKKPNVAVAEHCFNTLGETAQTSLFVGDSEIDMKTARNANITFWAVPYGYNGGRDIRLSNPDKLIEDISAVTQFFS